MPSNVVGAKRSSPSWIPATIITLLTLATWPLAVSPLVNLETSAPAPSAHLALGAGFVALAPICDLMDSLTLLSVSQTIAFLVSLAALYVVWRELRWRRVGSTLFREVRLAIVALASMLAFYAMCIVAPRPMARLTLDDADAVSVDVHSHTRFSHDGRSSFTPDANRAWHRDAGFDVAFITDHSRFEGAREAMQRNPARAGDGLTALSGVEFVGMHNHLVALQASDSATARLGIHSTGGRAVATGSAARYPVLVQTIPDNLDRLVPPDSSGRYGVIAIELSDGSPRGIEQSQHDRSRIVRLADSLNLALVAGSDNHGWGRTAVAWSVLHIPGWRSLSPDSLGNAIVDRIRTARRRSVEVIARRTPDAAGSRVFMVATLPAVAWNILRTMSPLERITWITWAWIATALAVYAADRRTPIVQ
jgi:predicted metal-dependent phosphoesterase TrpH